MRQTWRLVMEEAKLERMPQVIAMASLSIFSIAGDEDTQSKVHESFEYFCSMLFSHLRSSFLSF
jgi:hypothetical protein